MKIVLKILLFLLVLGVAAPFFLLKKEDGRPLLSLDDIKAPNLSLPDIAPLVNEVKVVMPTTGLKEIDKETREIYKWQDEYGEWHFSDEPRPD